MTRQPPVLTPAQRAELTTYRDGAPHKFDARPNRNLIRRDLLRLAPDAGRGFYRITGSGLLALDGDGRAKADQKVFTLPDVARRAGIEYRTAHMWMKSGLLTPSLRETGGTGHPALFSEQDVIRATGLARLRRAGLSVEGLHLVAADARVLRDMLTEWIRVEKATRG